MIEFDRIKSIFKSLSTDEIKNLRKLFSDTSVQDIQVNHSITLFNILISSTEINIDQLYSRLYGSNNKVALKKLLQRFTEKVLEGLISRELLIRNTQYDQTSRIIFEIKRKMLYYDVLAYKGITKYALMILDQVIKQAIKLEYYDYVIIGLEKKLLKVSLRHGTKNFNNIYGLLKFYSDCNSALKHALYLKYLYVANKNYNKWNFSKVQLLDAIRKVTIDYERTRSKRIKYELFIIKGFYFNFESDYKSCRANFKVLYNYLRSSNVIKWGNQEQTCILNIAEAETMLFNHSISLGYLNRIDGKFMRNEYNRKIVFEMKFFNHFYIGDIDNSNKYVKKLLETSNLDTASKFIQSKRYLYLAALTTISGDYIGSNRFLVNCNAIGNDKDGWNIGVRLLSILNNVELDKLLLVEAQIENFRKYIARIEGNNVFINRLNLISKILIYLKNNSFDFKLVNGKCNKYLDKLRMLDPKYSWKVKSPELILFHEWFDAKVKGVPYNHTEVMQRLKKANKG